MDLVDWSCVREDVSVSIQEELDKLRDDRARRVDAIRNSGPATGEAWIAVAIMFAGCVIAESLDRVALTIKVEDK